MLLLGCASATGRPSVSSVLSLIPMLAYSRRSLLQRSIIFAPPSQRRATTLPRPKLTGPRPPSPDLEQRYIRWVTSFAAGFSIYFFLDNPWHVAPAPESDRLSAMRFTPCRLIHSEESGPNSKLLEIAIPPHLLPSGHRDEKFKSIWSVFVKDDDIQVERPYTPLNGIDDEGRMLFWIKKYPKGEVGRWLHSKNTGDKIELRGPLQTWPWKDDTWDDIVMVRHLVSLHNYSAEPCTDFRRDRHHTFRATIQHHDI